MEKHVVLVTPTKNQEAVYGILMVVQGDSILFVCRTLENIDKLFPAGEYVLKLEYSPRFDAMLWELYGVKGRAEIKIHIANFFDQLDGCIAVGEAHIDMKDKKHALDGIKDVTTSAITLDKFHNAMKGITESRIKVLRPFDI